MIGGVLQNLLWNLALLMLILIYVAGVGILLTGQRYMTMKKKKWEWLLLLCTAIGGILAFSIVALTSPGLIRPSSKGILTEQPIYRENINDSDPVGYQILSRTSYDKNGRTVHEMNGIGKFVLKTKDGFDYFDVTVKNGEVTVQGEGNSCASQIERTMRTIVGKNTWNSFSGKTESYKELQKTTEKTVYTDSNSHRVSGNGRLLFMICILPAILLLFDYIRILRKRRKKQAFLKTRLQDL